MAAAREAETREASFNCLFCTGACVAGAIDDVLAELNSVKGDTDGNGQVEFTDFLVLSANFGQAGNYTQGDFDCDGQIEFADFLLLSANFGKSDVLVAQLAGGNPSDRSLVRPMFSTRQSLSV